MNIDEILEMMEELLDNSSAVPLSSKKLIDCEQMRDYIDKLRMDLPTEIDKAKKIQSERDTIIAEANKQADEIRAKADEAVEAAKQRAKQIMSESEITRQAKEYASELIRQAQENAAEIVADARDKDAEIRRALSDNVNKSLADAQAVLKKNLDDVTATMEAVEKLNAPAQAAKSEDEAAE
jgi:F0F1-type ATP synthase membrane subunit b/b'